MPRKHIILIIFLAIYGIGMGIYEYTVNHAELKNVVLTWLPMALILVLLFFVLRKKERIKAQYEQSEVAKQIKAQAEEDDDDNAAAGAERLPHSND